MAHVSRRGLFWVGVFNVILLTLLCIILLKGKGSSKESHGANSLPEQKARSSDQINTENHFSATKDRNLESIAKPSQTSDLQTQNTNDPLPIEWEGPVIAVLNNSYQNGDERNKALTVMALQTAKHVPRVQQECLMHLAYSLRDDDYESFLGLATNISIPVTVRLKFLDEVFSIRPKELTKWLGQNLLMTSDPALISRAKELLKKQEQMELLQSSQPEPPIQHAEPSPVK